MNTKASILVVGKTGQLATSLQKHGKEKVVCVGRPEADLACPECFSEIISQYSPQVIVNAAAWTAVDLAEEEKESANIANNVGPQYIAREAALRDIPFIHVSTDYVFNGRKGSPYVETDPISPVTVYGYTKAEGEKAVLRAHPKSIILRTSWVYSATGKNFVKTMLNAATRYPALRVVGDQYGNPTSSDDLAVAILSIISRIRNEGWHDQYHGIFHASGSGEASWHDLAVHVLTEAEKYGQKRPEIASIKTEEWPTPAERPSDSRLDTQKLYEIFGIRFPEWQKSVSSTVKDIMQG